MWSIDHPARTFSDYLAPLSDGKFVLNVLVSAPKWDACPSEELTALSELTGLGVAINRITIPDSTNSNATCEAVHVAWSVNLE
jgi:hypothetical protein